ncbi:hypothetical protein RclHR1_03260006 [Rhizophagus clarus]|uniref:S-adenosyl-L-methionine-dependent methyltransferase n=1 Tax=Rhizophagus clarus TaxID=94130 RepID=A0A2Z6S3D5_9GLOM|nr:hypothetical protein RclHR1_03260006 [Rhizophagus clarus]GES76945.1 S-adenosyl-L-methionine-dependent methyltransferase [Rhizophagus clarus]
MGKSQSKVTKLRRGSRDDYIHECINKRKYYASYIFPSDDDEIDRLTVQHYIFQNIWDSNFSSPVKNLLKDGAEVLDVGCGPGVWILEMAEKYKNSSFTGIDIAANFPQMIKPENTKFITGDFKRLPFEDNTFDFVYMRFMMFAITIEDWPEAIDELIRVCKPNGWIEIMERDILWFNESELVHNWRTTVVDKLREEKGIELVITPHIPRFLYSNDKLTNIRSDQRDARISWGGKIYEAYGNIIMWGAKNLSNAISEVHFDEGEYDSLVDVAIQEIARNKGYDKSYRFWAQKKVY